MDTLRQYQIDAINGVKQHEKNLIYLATGSGKSVIFKHLINNALAKNQKVLFLVARQQVLTQAFEKHFGHIKNKSMMMGANKYDLTGLLCASIDTLAKRPDAQNKILNLYDYYIIDEAHDCTADKYKNFLDQIPENKTVTGFSATPFRVGKKTHHFWKNIIHPITTLELIKQGHLVFPKVFSAEIPMKTPKKIIGGDYNNKALFDANDDMKVYGDIVKEYIKHGQNQKAFCFAINIEHSKKIADEFKRHNIKAVHVDSNDDKNYRKKTLNEFEFGDIQILCNVNLFSTGTDITCATVGIMARPTKSRILWIQQVGRLLRPHKDKKFAIILDHGGNTSRLGHPINDFPADITENKPQEPTLKTYQCPKCFYMYSEDTKKCPNCFQENEKLIRKIKEKKDAELKEIKLKNKIDEYDLFKNRYLIDYQGQNFNALDLKNKINNIFLKAKHWKHKKNSIFFKTWDLTENKNDLN